MHSRRLFLISAVSFVIALVSLWSKWNGSAGINAGDSIDAWSVSFNGSVHGWAAMIGILSLLIGIGLAIVGLIRTLTD